MIDSWKVLIRKIGFSDIFMNQLETDLECRGRDKLKNEELIMANGEEVNLMNFIGSCNVIS